MRWIEEKARIEWEFIQRSPRRGAKRSAHYEVAVTLRTNMTDRNR